MQFGTRKIVRLPLRKKGGSGATDSLVGKTCTNKQIMTKPTSRIHIAAVQAA